MLDGLYVSVIGDGGEGPYEAGFERAQYSPEPNCLRPPIFPVMQIFRI